MYIWAELNHCINTTISGQQNLQAATTNKNQVEAVQRSLSCASDKPNSVTSSEMSLSPCQGHI